uniref:Thioredoxin domain-containing protein n=1 Tax=Amblyomma cajennense TaxID=34607 RepID=A0A023FH01_AMBCJ
MDMFKGKTLVRKDGSECQAEDALGSTKVVALYFSAHWCPPCRMFTPVLAEAYKEMKDESAASVEVIFVSSDRANSDMLSYMKESHGDWYAVKFGDPFQQELKTKYGISGIPTLIVVKRDGTVITANGRGDIQTQGPRAFVDWANAA